MLAGDGVLAPARSHTCTGGRLPELPEVEVTRRRIAPLLVGRRIAHVHTTADSYFFVTKPDALRAALMRRIVEGLERTSSSWWRRSMMDSVWCCISG